MTEVATLVECMQIAISVHNCIQWYQILALTDDVALTCSAKTCLVLSTWVGLKLPAWRSERSGCSRESACLDWSSHAGTPAAEAPAADVAHLVQ